MRDFLSEMHKRVKHRVALMPSYQPAIKQSRSFCQIFSVSPAMIAEIKYASPSKGKIYKGSLSSLEIAGCYLENGASALSILTEPDYFKGSINRFIRIREKYQEAFLLMKDFILDVKQIYQAIAIGADAVLLMVSFLPQDLLKKLFETTQDLGMTPLVEVHDEKELERALLLSPSVIGINNRDLKTLKVDDAKSKALVKHIPEEIFKVYESGLHTREQVQSGLQSGFDGFLVGSHLMAQTSPGAALADLLRSKA